MFRQIFQIMHQVFLACWLEEKFRQCQNGIGSFFLGMFGQIVNSGYGCPTNVNHAFQIVFATGFEPFFEVSFAFINSLANTFAGCPVDEHPSDSALLQPSRVLINDIVSNRLLSKSIQHNLK